MRSITFSLVTIFFLSLLFSCSNSSSSAVLDKNDYDQFLDHDVAQDVASEKTEFEFWFQKYKSNPNQYLYLSKMAVSNENLFSLTGNIEYLTKAASNLEIANEKTNHENPGLLRALAKNYISQHRFQESKRLLVKAESIGQSLMATQKMLFDVNLEIGNDEAAENYLESLSDKNEFDYLIRRSKWEDHNGNLDQAIAYMESALNKAKTHGNKSLIQWSHTNLADFYGHAGRINDAYQNYIEALKIAPSDAYAKKGLAWIAYSYENDTNEAKRIIQKINGAYNAPDYFLLQSEIAEHEGNEEKKNVLIQQYLTQVKDAKYGQMYNKYNISILSEEMNNTVDAMQLAKEEIATRPTPQSYGLLAWTHYLAGENEKALDIITQHVEDKSSEPEILYQMAAIFKENNLIEKLAPLKKDLLDCKYELGPVYAKKIALL